MKPFRFISALLTAGLTLATGVFGKELIVNYVSHDTLAPAPTTTNVVAVPLNPPVTVAATPKKSDTTGDRWGKFEAEFGIAQRSSSPIKGSLQDAKYQLDWTTFALHEFAENVADRLRFNYSMSDIGLAPVRSKPARVIPDNFVDDAMLNLRLKTVIDLNLGKKSFVGVQLVLPVGD